MIGTLAWNGGATIDFPVRCNQLCSGFGPAANFGRSRRSQDPDFNSTSPMARPHPFAVLCIHCLKLLETLDSAPAISAIRIADRTRRLAPAALFSRSMDQARSSNSFRTATRHDAFTSTAPTNAIVGGATYTVRDGNRGGSEIPSRLRSATVQRHDLLNVDQQPDRFVHRRRHVCYRRNEAGNSSYASAPQKQQSFNVAPSLIPPQTITFTSTAQSNASVSAARPTPLPPPAESIG